MSVAYKVFFQLLLSQICRYLKNWISKSPVLKKVKKKSLNFEFFTNFFDIGADPEITLIAKFYESSCKQVVLFQTEAVAT